MFGKNKKSAAPKHSRKSDIAEVSVSPQNWNDCLIKPQVNELPTLMLPGFDQYVNQLITAADRIDVDMLGNNVLIGVLRVVSFQLTLWADALNLKNEVSSMFDQVIVRKDADFQILIYALSYLGPSGFALSEALAELLEEDLPGMIIPDIRDGKFDKLYLEKIEQLA